MLVSRAWNEVGQSPQLWSQVVVDMRNRRGGEVLDALGSIRRFKLARRLLLRSIRMEFDDKDAMVRGVAILVSRNLLQM